MKLIGLRELCALSAYSMIKLAIELTTEYTEFFTESAEF